MSSGSPSTSPRRARLLRVFPILLLMVVVAEGILHAGLIGEVRTLEGKRHRGEIRLHEGGFQVVDAEEVVTEVPADHLKHLHCRAVSEAELRARKAGGNGLTGVYYDGLEFTGTSLQRVDPAIDFRLGDRAPISGLKKDQFSIRWTGQVLAPEDGGYEFVVETDDGGRLWVGDQLLVDRWGDQSAGEGKGSIVLVKGVKYPIRFDYYENGGEAVARLLWKVPGKSKEVIPSSHLFPAAPEQAGKSEPGLVGRYFKGPELAGTARTRIDPDVNFDWGEERPIEGFDNDNFSVRWSGEVEAPSTGRFVFYIVTNDGGRLWVDGKLLIDQWRSQSATEGRGELELKAGENYSIRMEHFQNSGTAVAKLLWEGPSVEKSVIPNSRLRTGAGPEAPVAAEGLLGLYFRGTDLSGSPKYRNDPQVDFDWKREQPMSGVGNDDFSVRWQGLLKAPRTEPYTFHVEADDGVRLWVDHDLLIDAWMTGVRNESSQPVELKADEEYDIRLEYYEKEAGALIRLGWSSPTLPRAVIPSKALVPAAEADARRTMMLGRKGVPEGVVMSDGTIVARRVREADETVVSFSSSRTAPTLSTPGVSWIVLQSLAPELAGALSPERAGVMLQNGDFIDGEFKGMASDRVRISSVLFGIRSFERGRVSAIVLRPVQPVKARFEVRSIDGSVFVVDQFQIRGDGVEFENSVLGGLRVAAGELLEVRRVIPPN